MSNGCETAITKTGWGPCHYILIGLCGVCSIAEACASLTSLIVIPLLACDLKWHRSEATALYAVSSFGMAVGAIFFGTIADTNGRKGSIPATLAVVFCSSIALAFAQTKFLINVSIFVLGAGLAGNNTVLRVYLIECLPTKKRGCYMAVLDMLWIIGFLLVLGISWSLVPSVVHSLDEHFRPSSWRVLAGLGGTPSLVMACIVGLLPPSPRYLLYRQRHEEALIVLQQMYAINNSKHTDTYPATDLESCVHPDDDDDDDDANSLVSLTRKYFTSAWKRVREIFRAPLRRTTLLGTLACLLHFPGPMWLSLWCAHLLQEMEKSKDDKSDKGGGPCNVGVENVTLSFLRNCREVNHGRFEYLLFISLSYVVGEGLLAVGIDRIGRRKFLVISGLVGGSSLAIIFATQQVTRVVSSAFLLAAFAIGYTTTNILIMENYPTRLRGTIVGFVRIMPHLTLFVTKLVTKISCLSSIFMISGILVGAAIAALALPDLTRAHMQE